VKNLPPTAEPENIALSGKHDLVFFRGTKEKRDLFFEDLKKIDRPRPQLRYELLVVEYSKNDDKRFGSNLSLKYGSPDAGSPSTDSYRGSLNLANIMDLGFDVLTQFGLDFAASLSFQLGSHQARVFADTTLHGLSGEEIRFQNTDTYRYQELEADRETGKLIRSGITREISSGLIVGLSGWVSGDDMITMQVNATVSKQNHNKADGAGAIPSTSERIVNTQIRSPSGKPIVLSGLRNEASSSSTGWTPWPNTARTLEKTEVVIYIVPYLVNDRNENETISDKLERYYYQFMGDKK
jgi:type II secretory pathway component GspD/PulD (secretin)